MAFITTVALPELGIAANWRELKELASRRGRRL
jgi:hypothetical protein